MPVKTIKKGVRFAFGEGGSIKTRVLRSGIWVGIGEIGFQLLRFVRSVWLARLLTPEAFGLMGLAMIVVRGIETVTRPGIGQALIARQQDFDEAAATAFTLLVARGVLLTLVFAAAAPWVAQFYEQNELELVLLVLSVVFVIGSLSNINLIAKHRELDFRSITYLNQVETLISTIATIAAAWWLRSVWALVIGQIVQAGVTTLLSYYFIGGRVKFAFNADVARDLFKYGKFITGSSIVVYIATEIDSAVIGKLLGTEQLGFYVLAAMVANLVTLTLSRMASRIMMPAYSKLQSDLPALRQAYLKVLSLVMFFVLPATAGLVCLAEPLLVGVYGEKWVAAAEPLQLLALFGLLRALFSFNGYLFEGIGKPNVSFYLGLVRLAAIAPLIVPMVKAYGLFGAAITVTIGAAAQWLLGLVYLRKYVGIRVAQMMVAIGRPLWTAGVMSVAVYVVSQIVEVRSLSGLTVAVFSGIAAYAVLNASVLMKLKRATA